MTTSNEFWSNRDLWPGEMPGYRFLAPAMLHIGAMYFGEEWRGDEPWVTTPPVLTLTMQPPVHDRETMRYAFKLLQKPLFLYEGASSDLPIARPPLLLSDQEWAEARRLNSEDFASANASQARWRVVRELTEMAFKTGALKAYLRRLVGGGYVGPQPVTAWNNERNFVRFGLCQFDLGSPDCQANYEAHRDIRARSYSAQDYRYIFVAQTDLLATLELVKSLKSGMDEAAPVTEGDTKGDVDGKPRTNSSKAIEEYCTEVRQAVIDSPERPPRERQRPYWIKRGQSHYNIPKRFVEQAYRDTLLSVAKDIPHGWSKLGRKPNADTPG